MAAEPCRKCGKLRKIDIIVASDGWHQPPCFHCGDPGYIEPLDKAESFFERVHGVEELVRKANEEQKE